MWSVMNFLLFSYIMRAIDGLLTTIFSVYGLKCNVEQRLQAIFLIASNAAALLPAFKVLQQKVRSKS